MLAACLYWDSFSVLRGASASVFAFSLATSTGSSCLHGNVFLMSAYLHIRTAQSEGKREKVRKAEEKELERGRRNQTMPSPQGPSLMQLSLPFDTLTKEGQT